jgi:hypothetical protein
MKTLPGILLLVIMVQNSSLAITNDSLFVRIAGDSVGIWDLRAESNCASRFSSALTLSHDTLTWVQTDTVGPLARCICTYDMLVSMTGLTPGTYTAHVYRQLLKQYHYGIDTVLDVGSVTFTVGLSAGPFAARAFYQSDCLGATGMQEAVTLTPSQVALCNYPNPFNPMTVIRCQWPVAGWVTLTVYDMLGREVKTLVNEQKAAGLFTFQFDGGGLSSGVYLCRLRVQATDADATGHELQSSKPVMMSTMMILTK